jgi:PPOX class probable F420-dependent enzyme
VTLFLKWSDSIYQSCCIEGGCALTPEAQRRLAEFLQPSHIAVIATIGPSGMPQLTPNWYDYTDGKVMISTTKERVKYRNLVRDSRMTVCIYTERDAQDYATMWGHVTIRDDDSIWPDTRAIVERYVSSDGVEARMAQLHTQNRVVIDFEPERVMFRT